MEQKSDKQRPMPYSYLFRLVHWLLGLSMLVLIATGLSLHAIARPDWSLTTGHLPSWFWPGRVNMVHLLAAIIFACAVICSLTAYALRKRRVRQSHLTLLIGGLVMFATAQVLLNPMGPPVVYTLARLTHAIVGLVVLPITLVWHVSTGLGRYRGLLVASFHPLAGPRFVPVTLFVLLLGAVACLVLNGLPIQPAGNQLTAAKIAKPAEDLVDLEKLPWNEAKPLVVELANGGGFVNGRTRVTLRALHDGDELFVLAQWLDPTEDRQYQPWQKTPDGWKWLNTGGGDESVYYEDKFSLVFPIESNWQFERFGCAMTCHADSTRPHGHKDCEGKIDVWHWKGTRTDPVGQIDDKYWWKFDPADKPGGRFGDPKESGGYKKNVSKDKTRPEFLPDGPEAVKQGVILFEHAKEYTPEAAALIRVGQIVPGIVAAPAVGDRGDALCQSIHQDGVWKVFIRRKLDTGSEYDVQFTPGKEHPFGVAAFDCTSKRHAYNLSTYRLLLEQ